MKAFCMTQGVWRIVNGTSTRPVTITVTSEDGTKTSSSPADPAQVEAWDSKAEKAAGYIYLMLEDSQKIHASDHLEDPKAMWAALEAVYLQKKPGQRFNAYDDLLAIRKKEDETLQGLLGRVDDAFKLIKDLRPKPFSLDDFDKELASMVLIRALPEEYNAFSSSLLLMDKLDKDTIAQAFVAEEAQRRHRSNDAPSAAMAARAAASLTCHFCSRPGHIQAECNSYQRAQATARENASKPHNRHKKSGQQAQNTPSTASAAAASTSGVTEFAGHASVRAPDPSSLFSPLQLKADFDWIADTGATSHMTPHRHFMRNYTPCSIPVRLADHSVIFAVGMGTVVFDPVLDGKLARSVEFTRVLHVPELRSNLISCLYLTRVKGLTMLA